MLLFIYYLLKGEEKMLNFMKKFPAGIVLIPMFLSALFYAFPRFI